MTKIRFNDGHPSIDVKILVKAESIILAKDEEDHFVLIKRSKLDEAPEVDFSDELEGIESEIVDEETAEVIIAQRDKEQNV